MNVEPKSLNEILRFLVTGYVFYIIAKYVKFTNSLGVLIPSGSVEKQLLIFTVGIFLYYLFRTVIYPLIIFRFIDSLNRAGSVRAAIQDYANSLEAEDRPENMTWAETNDIYHLIVQRRPKWDVDSSRLWSHSIYMLFICGLLASMGCLYAIFVCRCHLQALVLGAGGTLLISAGFWSDWNLENRIYRNVAILNRSEFQKELKDYFSNRKAQ